MAERKLPAGVPEAFRALMKRPVSFFPAIARLCGSASAGLFLSQAIFWDGSETVIERTPPGGQRWFWKSAKDWQKETCLSTREQQTARAICKAKGFISEKLIKIDGAPVLHFLVNIDAIIEAHMAACSGESEAKKDLAIPPNPTPNQFGDSDKSMDLDETPNENQDLAKMDKSKTPNAISEEAETRSENTKRLDTKEGEAPPSALTISREKMMRNLTTEPGNASDREVMEAVHRARAAGGLDASQAKAYLGTFMVWRLWCYFDQIDAQQQIVFPEPPKPQPRPLPEDFNVKAAFRWDQILKAIQPPRISRHSFDTWLKPTKGRGVWRGVLYVEVPTEEFRHIGEKFGEEIAQHLGEGIRDVKFVTRAELEDWRESA